MPLVAMLDANISNKLRDKPEDAALLRAAVDDGRLRPLTTHVQEDEIRVTPDGRGWSAPELAEAFVALGCEPVVTSVAVYGVSTYGESSYGGSDAYEEISGNRPKEVRDAIITATAVSRADVLVTEDSRLRRRARRHVTVDVWSFEDLVDRVRARVL
jgi:hypothetical protein